MAVDSYTNNCVLVAIRILRPDIPEELIEIDAYVCGFNGEGMFDWQWKNLLIKLGIKYKRINLKEYHPNHSQLTLKRNMTLGRVANLTKDYVCMVKISGHVVITYHGEIIDPNRASEGPRRRVFDTYRIINHQMSTPTPRHR